jgi:hypothetical protein
MSQFSSPVPGLGPNLDTDDDDVSDITETPSKTRPSRSTDKKLTAASVPRKLDSWSPTRPDDWVIEDKSTTTKSKTTRRSQSSSSSKSRHAEEQLVHESDAEDLQEEKVKPTLPAPSKKKAATPRKKTPAKPKIPAKSKSPVKPKVAKKPKTPTKKASELAAKDFMKSPEDDDNVTKVVQAITKSSKKRQASATASVVTSPPATTSSAEKGESSSNDNVDKSEEEKLPSPPPDLDLVTIVDDNEENVDTTSAVVNIGSSTNTKYAEEDESDQYDPSQVAVTSATNDELESTQGDDTGSPVPGLKPGDDDVDYEMDEEDEEIFGSPGHGHTPYSQSSSRSATPGPGTSVVGSAVSSSGSPPRKKFRRDDFHVSAPVIVYQSDIPVGMGHTVDMLVPYPSHLPFAKMGDTSKEICLDLTAGK